jgi:TonB family protein
MNYNIPEFMIAENLIFKTALMVSVAVHMAGFGLLVGASYPFVKNSSIEDNSVVVIYEVGFINAFEKKEDILIWHTGKGNGNKKALFKLKKNINASCKKGSSGESNKKEGGLKEKYLLKVRKQIERFKYYPGEARKRCLSGEIVLSFFIDQNGTVQNLKIVKSSGFFILDNAGKDTILKASPFPSPPKPEFGNIQTTVVFRSNQG